jgi:shikimate dehydrogenase
MKLYAVIGNPIAHSKSPLIHNSAYKAIGFKNICYTRVLLEDEKDLKSKIISLGLSGANITVPFKEEAFRICDEVDAVAAKTKAVNTIVVKDGKFYGYNTDAPGFVAAAKSFEYKSVLILGAGGTARSIAFALQDKNPTIINRSADRLQFLKESGFSAILNSELNKDLKFDLIVNSTSAGLKDEYLPLDKQKLKDIFANANGAIDCVYGKVTPFVALANECGLGTKDGKDMLLEQAFLAFEHFFSDIEFDKKVAYSAMKESFYL